jgi:hypothetical protein
MSEDVVERLRGLCLAYPEVTERISHGTPSWFVRGKKTFVSYVGTHHGSRLAFWCAAPEGAQDVLIGAEPERYFVPPYVGHRGWLGVFLDVEVDWGAIELLVDAAFRCVAPRTLVARLEASEA